MPKRHQVIPRTMCFVFNQDEVLLMKAASHKDWHGRFDPLGGHIEKGESVLSSARREIKEESGLSVKNTKLKGIIHVSNFFGKEIIMFVTSSTTTTKNVRSNQEGELLWVKINQLKKLNVLEDVKPILKQLIKLKKGEIFLGTSKFDGKDKLLALDVRLN